MNNATKLSSSHRHRRRHHRRRLTHSSSRLFRVSPERELSDDDEAAFARLLSRRARETDVQVSTAVTSR